MWEYFSTAFPAAPGAVRMYQFIRWNARCSPRTSTFRQYGGGSYDEGTSDDHSTIRTAVSESDRKASSWPRPDFLLRLTKSFRPFGRHIVTLISSLLFLLCTRPRALVRYIGVQLPAVIRALSRLFRPLAIPKNVVGSGDDFLLRLSSRRSNL